MVAAACALRVLGAGLHSFGFTVFFLPLSQDLDLNRTSTSLAFSLARAEGALEGPIVGHLLDRYGPKPIMLAAVLLMGVGYLLLAQVNNYAAFLLVYLGVISLSHAGGFMHAPMVLINTWFIRHRARAIAISSAAFGMGGVLLGADPKRDCASVGVALGRCRSRCFVFTDWYTALSDDSPLT